MTFQLQKKLSTCNEQIRDSVKQLDEYCKRSNVIKIEYLAQVGSNIASLTIDSELQMIENSILILEELKTLLNLEQKRRPFEARLTVVEQKNCLKRERKQGRDHYSKRRRNPYSRNFSHGKLLYISLELNISTTQL